MAKSKKPRGSDKAHNPGHPKPRERPVYRTGAGACQTLNFKTRGDSIIPPKSPRKQLAQGRCPKFEKGIDKEPFFKALPVGLPGREWYKLAKCGFAVSPEVETIRGNTVGE
jgi:hypothetical protein